MFSWSEPFDILNAWEEAQHKKGSDAETNECWESVNLKKLVVVANTKTEFSTFAGSKTQNYVCHHETSRESIP